ncbi:MAG: hypothetical protein A2V85_01815 [Chloroflexi bacterium RBG_16_72_14]|nr:MAG: hypothetical protein A2V85_01815 [Chloroflexi bacterium RBG_16_72_14]
MRRTSGRVAVSVVLMLLGFLVVVQLRSQAADPGLVAMSAQDLTVLVASLTTRNNQLREEIATLERQRGATAAAVQRGDTSVEQIRADLDRIRGWSGALPIAGPGVRVLIEGPIPGDAVSQLINELRNAGADGIAIGDIRDVPGIVVTGPAGELTVSGIPISGDIELIAVGQPEALSGSLTRAGGPIAQLGARFPEVPISVLPDDSVVLPATDRDLAPALGRPRL